MDAYQPGGSDWFTLQHARILELWPAHEPVLDRCYGGEAGGPNHREDNHPGLNVLDQVLFYRVTPEGMNVIMYYAPEHAKRGSE